MNGSQSEGRRKRRDFLRENIAGALLLFLLACVCGCASRGRAGLKPPEFPRDTLAITNETKWSYVADPVTGALRHEVKDPPPVYSLRCFVLSRTVKQFHSHADFAPAEPTLDEAGYRRLIRRVVRRSPRDFSAAGSRVVVPGYNGLFAFSAAWPRLFQEECGGAWESYVQRGHWRMVMPFTKRAQRGEAAELLRGVRDRRAPVVHLVDFPRLRMNHAVTLLDAADSESEIRFTAYDPNSPGRPVTLTFDKARGRFVMQPVAYYPGGIVSAYEVYCRGLR